MFTKKTEKTQNYSKLFPLALFSQTQTSVSVLAILVVPTFLHIITFIGNNVVVHGIQGYVQYCHLYFRMEYTYFYLI